MSRLHPADRIGNKHVGAASNIGVGKTDNLRKKALMGDSRTTFRLFGPDFCCGTALKVPTRSGQIGSGTVRADFSTPTPGSI